MFSKLTRRLFCSLALLMLSCTPVLGISQDEYAALMRNSDFARADKRINTLWDKVQRIAPQSVLNFLKQAQTEWWDYNLDSRAEDFINNDKLSREEAYTKAINQCADDLKILLNALTTPVKTNKLIGKYIRKWDDDDTGWLTVKWVNKKKSEVKIEIVAWGSLDAFGRKVSDCEWQGIIKNGVLAVHEPSQNDEYNAHIIFIFEGDKTVLVRTTSHIYIVCGMGAYFDGEYKRAK